MLFSRKKIEPGPEEEVEQKPEPRDESMVAELARVKASLDSLMEIKKSTTELFYRLNEQIGELRAMIVNTDKSVQEMEAKTVKTVSLVEALEPEKIMISLQKQDGKVESLRANIESNEAVMGTISGELKEMRRKINEFKGMEQIVKLYNETKNSLIAIQRTEANTSRHADRVETIFGEFQKTYQESQRIQGEIENFKKSVNNINTQLDKLKLEVAASAKKKEVEDVITKATSFEKSATNLLELLDRRAKSIPVQLNEAFKAMEKEHREFVAEQVEKSKKAMAVFEEIEKKAPELSEKLKLDELHYDEQEPESEEPAIPLEEEKPKGFLNSILGRFRKK